MQYLEPVAELFVRLRITPNQISTLALLAGIVCAYFFFQGQFVIGSLALLVSAIFDLIDGSVARKTNAHTNFGAAFDWIVDKYVDGLVLLGVGLSGIAILSRFLPVPPLADFVIVGFAIIGSLMNTFIKPVVYAEIGYKEKVEGKIDDPLEGVGFFGRARDLPCPHPRRPHRVHLGLGHYHCGLHKPLRHPADRVPVPDALLKKRYQQFRFLSRPFTGIFFKPIYVSIFALIDYGSGFFFRCQPARCTSRGKKKTGLIPVRKFIRPQFEDLEISLSCRKALRLCPAQHPALDKIVFAEDPKIPEERCPEGVVVEYDALLVPEVPFYPLKGEPVKFHGKRCMEPERFLGIHVVLPQRAVRGEGSGEPKPELSQLLIRNDIDKDCPRIGKEPVSPDRIPGDSRLACTDPG